MEMPRIVIKFVITKPDGTKHHEGTYNMSDAKEKRACASRFNDCLLNGYTVTTRRVK